MEKKKRWGINMKTKCRHLGTSSTNSGLFSNFENFNEREEEVETLVSSSRSFSTESSTDFNPQLETIRESTLATMPRRRHKKNKKQKIRKRRGAKRNSASMTCPEFGSPARLSVFKKRIPWKVKESFAVVRKSEDPYEDFKRSMMEMIVEKQMFEESYLEELLQCNLSLNSRYHHGIIVGAFTEIWNTAQKHTL